MCVCVRVNACALMSLCVGIWLILLLNCSTLCYDQKLFEHCLYHVKSKDYESFCEVVLKSALGFSYLTAQEPAKSTSFTVMSN